MIEDIKNDTINKTNSDIYSLPILYVDDDKDNLEAFNLAFERKLNVIVADNARDALEILAKKEIGLIISDEKMPEMSGIEFLEKVVKRWPDTVRIIISAYSDADRLLRAINKGHVHEYIVKPWDKDELFKTLVNALKQVQKRIVLKSYSRVGGLLQRDYFVQNDIIYVSESFENVLKTAETVAGKDVPVLLTGETGTGKEVIANFIHKNSLRTSYPFIGVNCAAISENLLEDELFGHEKGAYTNANTIREGRFELANQGTLFLDEIGDISSKLQVSLLRVIQEQSFERLGGIRTIHTNVRLITATNRNLEKMVKNGEFRNDLYFRLNVVPIHIPPLRERREDIEPLFSYFVSKYQNRFALPNIDIDDDVLPYLKNYDWPGNVRELENMVQRALAISTDNTITLDNFFFDLRTSNKSDETKVVKDMFLKEKEHQIREALIKADWNCSQAARILDMPRSTLVKRAKKLGLI